MAKNAQLVKYSLQNVILVDNGVTKIHFPLYVRNKVGIPPVCKYSYPVKQRITYLRRQ